MASEMIEESSLATFSTAVREWQKPGRRCAMQWRSDGEQQKSVRIRGDGWRKSRGKAKSNHLTSRGPKAVELPQHTISQFNRPLQNRATARIARLTEVNGTG